MQKILPIYEIIDQIKNGLKNNSTVILSSPPGSGKTTIIPMELLHEDWLNKKILVLEPRRLAARNSAIRASELLGENVGNRIGYRIRFESKISSNTRIEYITEGIFLKKIQNDPDLSDTDLIIFDEFHERSLDTDLALSLLEFSRSIFKNNIKILIMSGTLNKYELREFYPRAVFLNSNGSNFHVDINYLKEEKKFSPELVYSTIKSLDNKHGDILVFLPGKYEIDKTYNLLNLANLNNIILYKLYSDLPFEEQKKVFYALENKRKIILSTNIAETSITIDGITIIIDSGLKRRLKFDIRSGMNRLITERIGLDSAEQRKGRTGRTKNGVCYRLWTKYEEKDFLTITQPEIIYSDLSNILLNIKKFGANFNELKWITQPPVQAINKGEELLIDLGAIDKSGKITRLGEKMADLPVEARLSAMILKSSEYGFNSIAIQLGVLLSDKIFNSTELSSTDLSLKIDYINSDNFKNHPSYIKFNNLYKELSYLISKSLPKNDLSIGVILAFAFPDRIAKNREIGKEKFKLSSGKGAFLSKEDHLCQSEFIVIAELDGDLQNSKIYQCVSITKNEIINYFSEYIDKKEIYTFEGNKINLVLHYYLKELLIEKKVISPSKDIDFSKPILEYLKNNRCKDLNWNDEVINFYKRVNFLSKFSPDFSSIQLDYLKENPENWLSSFIINFNSISQLKSLNILDILKSFYTYQQLIELDKEIPEYFISPAGNKIKIDYSENDVIIQVKLQELFGLTHAKTYAYGNILPTFHLLSPAGRPLQVTKDLESFWKNTYPEIKRELKGKYPKHPWPEDPYSAVPTARTIKAHLRNSL
jgi:ATP-dependent helicase HrpB